MSVNKLGIILFCGLLIVAMAPSAPAQSHQEQTKQPAKDAGKTYSSDSHSTATQTAAHSRSAKKSVSRDKVRQTQTALKQQGFYSGRIDGVMGAMTITALRNYQSHNGLEVTGTISTETESALQGRASISSTRSSVSQAPQALPRTDTNISDLNDVRQVQQRLADLMYNPGDANGMMSSQTQQAVREFQWLNNLSVTGTIDEQTRQAIDAQWNGSSYSSPYREKPADSPDVFPEDDQTEPRLDRPHGPSAAEQSSSTKPNKDAMERVEKAAGVLHELTGTADKRVPNELLERAEAIAVIPNVIKGAFGFGGRYGKGVVAQRAENGRWSSPSFIEIGGGSFGAQIGVTSTDLVLVFTDRKALNLLDGGKDLKLGVDAGVAAGPVGRSAEAGVNANLDTAIYAYSRSKGLFAGVSLDGAVLSIDKDMNEKVYGSSMSAEKILGGTVSANATVRPFMDALDKAVPRKRMSQR